MSTNTAPPGWHPDPSNPTGALRWWDGASWTDQTQQQAAPAANPGYPGYPAPNYPATNYAGGGYSQPPRTFAKQNSASVKAIAVVAIYVVLAVATHIVFIGIFPVLLAFRAVQRREQLAPVAVIAAIIAIAVAFLTLR
jgi:hypothetical protein